MVLYPSPQHASLKESLKQEIYLIDKEIFIRKESKDLTYDEFW